MKLSSNLINIKNTISIKLFSALVMLGFFMGMSLQSCSEDINDFRPFPTDENILTINFNIPESEHIVTRADEKDNSNERALDNLVLLIFDSNGKIVQREDIENTNSLYNPSIERQFEYTLFLSSAASEANGRQIYAIGNTKISGRDCLETYTNGSEKNKSDLEKEAVLQNPDGPFVMSGIAEESTSKSLSVDLSRSVAKVSVKNEITGNHFKLEDLNIYYTTEKSYITAANSSNYIFYPQNTPLSENKIVGKFNSDDSYYYSYVNPTVTHKDDVTAVVYVVIKAEYEGNEYYYALPIYDNKNKVFLDILPNHWYDMRITSVTAPGSSSEEEAMKNHNFNDIVVEIHDHAPDVMSMVSDGIHELGVSRHIELSANNPSDEILVKCYSVDNDKFDIKDLNIIITEGEDWFEIPASDNEDFPYSYTLKDNPENSFPDDKDNQGTQLIFKVNIKDVTFFSDETGIIEISYRGLKREVTVTYNSDFKVADICDVTLEIFTHGEDNKDILKITDYWTFVKGNIENGNTNKESDENTHPKLYGTDPEKLVGKKIRTQGLHFPMPYGKNNNWEYVYTVDFTKNWENIADVRARIVNTSDSFIRENIECSNFDKTNKTVKLTLKNTAQSSYTYATGTLTFYITFDDGTRKEINMSVYHTGFFHYEGDLDYVPAEDFGYYYYEVKPLSGKGDSKYWLDRNLGASSNLRYIDNENSLIDLGEPTAIGRFYNIADDKGKFVDPTFNDFMDKICPPGYHIPISAEWNDVRLSEDFMTESETYEGETFITAYYNIKNDKIGNVYFPKARYYQLTFDNITSRSGAKYELEANAGDSESGYYWTQTLAPGMEKENMGNWLRALYINGISTTYNNANITEHKLPVRLVAGKEPEHQSNNYISFNVHNVTHVYIFDAVSKSPLYPFPGKAVSSAASSEQWQYFNCTTTVPLATLNVVFTHRDPDGKVTIFKPKGNSFEEVEKLTDITDNVAENSWAIDAVLRKSLDFCTEGKKRDNYIADAPFADCGNEKDNPGSDSNKTIGGESNPIAEPFLIGDQIVFLWPKTIKGKDYPNIMAWNWTTTDISFMMGQEAAKSYWDGVQYQDVIDEMYSYTVDSSPWELKEFSVGVFVNSFNHVDFKIKHNEKNNKYYIEHLSYEGNSSLTMGGSITRNQKSGGGYIWTIQLYDYDEIESGSDDKPSPPAFNPDDYEFNIQDPDNETDLKIDSKYSENNFDNSDLANASIWSNIPTGAKLRFYTVKINDNYSLTINDAWNSGTKWEFSSSIPHNTDTNVSIIEIELTDEMLILFSGKGGMVINASGMLLLGVTIDTSHIKLASGNHTWTNSDGWDMNYNNKFTKLISSSYDWSEVNAGSTITIEWIGNNGGALEFKTADPETTLKRFETWSNDNNNKFINPMVITLDEETLSKIKNNGGCIFTGGNFQITKVEIKVK